MAACTETDPQQPSTSTSTTACPAAANSSVSSRRLSVRAAVLACAGALLCVVASQIAIQAGRDQDQRNPGSDVAWFQQLAGEEPSDDLSHSRSLQTIPAHCHPLNKEALQKIAKDNHVLISVMDELVWSVYGPSWVQNIKTAGITYWSIAALDPQTSMALGSAGK